MLQRFQFCHCPFSMLAHGYLPHRLPLHFAHIQLVLFIWAPPVLFLGLQRQHNSDDDDAMTTVTTTTTMQQQQRRRQCNNDSDDNDATITAWK